MDIVSIRRLEERARVRVLTHGEDVDGVVCAALALKRFPRAIIETGSPGAEVGGKYDIVVDLPLPRSLETHAWVDHHLATVEEGTCEDRVYDSNAPSAASLLARYLGLEAGELVGVADRADSAGYLTDPPVDREGSYDVAWDVNDAVKAVESEQRFVELARVLASEGPEAVKGKFWEEVSYIRGLRKGAKKIVRSLSRLVEERKPDSLIVLMPRIERGGSTVSGHIVFSLYPKGVRAFAIFYSGGPGGEGCWINIDGDFEGLDASAIARRFGGGGHRTTAGASIGPEKLDDVKREFERAGLKPMVVDLRGAKIAPGRCKSGKSCHRLIVS